MAPEEVLVGVLYIVSLLIISLYRVFLTSSLRQCFPYVSGRFIVSKNIESPTVKGVGRRCWFVSAIMVSWALKRCSDRR